MRLDEHYLGSRSRGTHPGLAYRLTLPATLVSLALAACTGDSITEPGALATVSVGPVDTTFYAIGVTQQFHAAGRDADGRLIPNVSFSWSSSEEDVATVTGAGLVTTVGTGEATITATADGVSGHGSVHVTTVVFETIDPFLATPASGHVWEVPVVIVRYLPTEDGATLDSTKAPDYWSLGYISLADLKARIDRFDRWVKHALEEGSRFRGYRDANADPSLGYRVVSYITVYEHMPAGHVFNTIDGHPIYFPDFHEIFARFNMADYVNNQGVREIWFWHTGSDPTFPSYDPELQDPADFRGMWESNMSGPNGDVSNSDRITTDLPVYNSTYVLYGQNFRRTQAEALHNHGHQLEAILSHANWLQDGNTDLFWKSFVGQNASGQHIIGRAGWTHMPPNTTDHYDYEDPALVLSDIEDWKPDGSGLKTEVNADTWGLISYDWPSSTNLPQQVETHWYVYWWQNMPGYNNAIPHGQNRMSNWWAFVTDWDAALASGLGLHEPVSNVAGR